MSAKADEWRARADRGAKWTEVGNVPPSSIQYADGMSNAYNHCANLAAEYEREVDARFASSRAMLGEAHTRRALDIDEIRVLSARLEAVGHAYGAAVEQLAGYNTLADLAHNLAEAAMDGTYSLHPELDDALRAYNTWRQPDEHPAPMEPH